MSVFYAVISEAKVVHTTKEVNSNVIKVEDDGTEVLFSDLSDHISITGFGECEPGDKQDTDGSWLKPGQDAQGNDRWYDQSTGNLMQFTYTEGGQIDGEEQVT